MPGGRLVEKKQLRLVQHRAAKRQPLLPSAREFSRKPIKIRPETVQLDDFIHAPLQPIGGQAVNAPIEREILVDRQIVVQTELLRHVADAFAHFFRMRANVEPFDLRRAAGKRQQDRSAF